jgi:hypothetical protein
MLMRFLWLKASLSLLACMQTPYELPSHTEILQLERDHRKALADALKAEIVRQFREIFPTKMITLSDYRMPAVKQTLTLQTSLYSRYEFRFDVGLKFDKTWTKVVGFGKPQFQLFEVKEIERLEDGRFYVSYRDMQRRFDEQEWKRLYEARRDFSVLGFNLRKDHPVPLFDEYWKAQQSRFATN